MTPPCTYWLALGALLLGFLVVVDSLPSNIPDEEDYDIAAHNMDAEDYNNWAGAGDSSPSHYRTQVSKQSTI